ncbi:MAG: Two-component system response regulator [Candidatus Moranbacteria bacterium GW2011_GWC2_37_8]|nr:MAG: Two-component system response regulator [Candidatus Moranbacteria bacterium GW2011_GWC2_37_8]KKQ61260.1 MAG: Two-component system response regulator [Parcubacteria group bacterium GW2011_GWC1_38_22]
MEKSKKILLVDDDVVLREMYAEIFQNANFEVIQASDGLEGLDVATKEIPDVIFTGIVMPRMDGFDMMEALKKTVMTANIPVVISSHMGRGEDQDRAKKLGAKDFIVRGITRPIEVIERISSIFIEAGKEYKLEFNPFALDAQELAKDLHFEASFLCLECKEKLVLNMQLKDPQSRTFDAHFVCPKCGWEAK